MIAWAEKQIPSEEKYEVMMKGKLGEAWGSEDCSLCQKYLKKPVTKDSCKICPLSIEFGDCGGKDVYNLWIEVQTSRCWQDWVNNARKFLKQIESLLK